MKYTVILVCLTMLVSCSHYAGDETIRLSLDELVPVPTGFTGYIYPNGSAPTTPPQFVVGNGEVGTYSAYFEWDPVDNVDYFVLLEFVGGRANWQDHSVIPGNVTSVTIRGISQMYIHADGLSTRYALNAYRSGIVCPNGIDWRSDELWYDAYKNEIRVPVLEEAP